MSTDAARAVRAGPLESRATTDLWRERAMRCMCRRCGYCRWTWRNLQFCRDTARMNANQWRHYHAHDYP
jgi:hypothetical protein